MTDPRTALTADEWIALTLRLRDLYLETATDGDQPVYIDWI